MDDEKKSPPPQYRDCIGHACAGMRVILEAVFEKSGMEPDEFGPFVLSSLTQFTAAAIVDMSDTGAIARTAADMTAARLKAATEELIETNLPKPN